MPSLKPSAWKHALRLTVGILALSAAGISTAQTLVSSDVAWPGLSRDDIDRMHAAAARLYEGRSIGTIERWRSPDSKDAGEVKLLESFEANHMPCRKIEYTIEFAVEKDRPSQYVMNWCKIPEGEWKIVELGPHR